MAKKEKYSLTAKQRRELNQKNSKSKDAKHQSTQADEVLTEDAIVAQEAEHQAAKQKQGFVTRLVALCLACVLAAGLIVTGIVFALRGGRYDNLGLDGTPVNPIAVITLSDNTRLEIELHFSQNRAAVANFIYLAENSFFNNTIFQTQAHDRVESSGYMAFSGFETPYRHRAQNQNFVAGLSGFYSTRSNVYNTDNFKLGYRITNSRVLPSAGQGVELSGRFGFAAANTATGSSTTFVMIYNESPQLPLSHSNAAGTISTTALGVSYLGRLTPESLAAVKRMANERNPVTAPIRTPSHRWIRWDFDEATPYIRSIRINRLNRGLRNRILDDFENVVLYRPVTAPETPRDPSSYFGGGVQTGRTNWQRTEFGTNTLNNYAGNSQVEVDITWLGQDGSVLSVQRLLHNTIIIPPEAPQINGYSFVRWEGFAANMRVSGYHTFTAVYEPAA